MAKTNVKTAAIHTHEGGRAKHINSELQLRRTVMSCMLWEKNFYEDGIEVAARIKQTIPLVDPKKVSEIAVEARSKMKLRHVPLLIAREMARTPTHKGMVAETLENIIQRADELSEFLAIYWKEKRQPLSAQVKKGIAAAFRKFSDHQLAKYNRDGAVKLRDALFLSHAKPKDKDQEKTWKQLVEGTLPIPDTWEVALSAGADKKATWERLMKTGKLGALALLRNLRNMRIADVKEDVIRAALAEADVSRVLPFRFIAASRYAPEFEPELEQALYRCVGEMDKLPGKTVVLVDVSGSMEASLSERSEMTMMDAACGVAMILREICKNVKVLTFSNHMVMVPSRRGFALRDVIVNSQDHGGTALGGAVRKADEEFEYDRLVVITDEQSHDSVPNPKGVGYMINVCTHRNGVGYGPWHHIDGFSEAVISYLVEVEKFNTRGLGCEKENM